MTPDDFLILWLDQQAREHDEHADRVEKLNYPPDFVKGLREIARSCRQWKTSLEANEKSTT